jgi:hypothetical protein
LCNPICRLVGLRGAFAAKVPGAGADPDETALEALLPHTTIDPNSEPLASVQADVLLLLVDVLGQQVRGLGVGQGRRRYLACARAAIPCATEEVNPPDPIALVCSLNIHRRNLGTGQRAMIAARMKGR